MRSTVERLVTVIVTVTVPPTPRIDGPAARATSIPTRSQDGSAAGGSRTTPRQLCSASALTRLSGVTEREAAVTASTPKTRALPETMAPVHLASSLVLKVISALWPAALGPGSAVQPGGGEPASTR
ncbi:MAG: hypothetical protein ACREMG_13385, partial [Gemmatimonadales bacterium]